MIAVYTPYRFLVVYCLKHPLSDRNTVNVYIFAFHFRPYKDTIVPSITRHTNKLSLNGFINYLGANRKDDFWYKTIISFFKIIFNSYSMVRIDLSLMPNY